MGGIRRGGLWVSQGQQKAVNYPGSDRRGVVITERKDIKTKLDCTKSERIQNRIKAQYRQKDKEE